MFERFTDGARRVVVLAQEEARFLHHDHISTAHLLLGLAGYDGGQACHALRAVGGEIGALRTAVREIAPAGPEFGGPGHLPFTVGAKHTLAGALREALSRNDDHIATGHVLLALICTDGGPSSRDDHDARDTALDVLAGLGVDLDTVRRQAATMLDLGVEKASALRRAYLSSRLENLAARVERIERHLGLPPLEEPRSDGAPSA